MEISVYYNQENPFFKRVVMCTDAFDLRAFYFNMKAIFGEIVVENIILT